MDVSGTKQSISAADPEGGAWDLTGQQAGTIELSIRATLGLALGVLAFGAFALNRVGPEIFAVAAELAGTAWLGGGIAPRSPRLAAAVVVGGLLVATSSGLFFFPETLLAPWYVVVVLVASALLGWRWGIGVATISTAYLFALARLPFRFDGDAASGVAISAALLGWAGLGAYWLISRPTRIALSWAWSSYTRALEQTILAREHQAELARLTKTLSESYYRVEQLNLELDQARRSAQEARRLKAQFAAAVSHELRTPLNLIIGFCEMMVLSPASAYGQRLPASYQGDLEAIYRNAGHIAALVDDILDLSQIDADRMALHREWVALEVIVEEAVTTVLALFEERGLDLRVETDEPLAAYVDRTRIRQILINLLSNAARFTEQGGVTVRTRRIEGTAVVSVQDTGPGIPANELPFVFEEFYQVSRVPRRGGTGLGLTVSKRFAELHGGTMSVESTPGQGTTFFLQLPVQADLPREAEDAVSWEDRVGRRARGEPERRLLVVDDTGQVHKVFQRYLDGYRVLHATSAAKARRVAHAAPVQAIVLGSPGAVAGWNAAAPSELARLPVITCVLRTARRTADALDVADYLVKPVSRDQLRAALHRLDRPIRRVLVVDDDAGMLRLLTRMLPTIARGCDVRVASRGDEALAILRTDPPDVVLLDLLMPGLNGYGVIEAMRAEPGLAHPPILVVTARGNTEENVVAESLSVTRAGGISVAEVMRWVRVGLDALLSSSGESPPVEGRSNGPARPEGSPA